MTQPQFGIFAQGTVAHEFLEFDLRPDVDLAAVGAGARTACACRPWRPVASTSSSASGRTCGARIAPDDAPADLAPFQPLGTLGGHHAPATQHDLWLWINGGTPDVVFEHARRPPATLDRVFVVASDQTGLRPSRQPRPDRLHRRHRQPDAARGAGRGARPGRAAAAPAAATSWRCAGSTTSTPSIGCRSRSRSACSAGPSRTASSSSAPGCRRTPTSRASRSTTTPARRSRSTGAACRTGRPASTASTSWPSARTATGSTGCCARMFGPNDDGLHDRLADFSRPVSGAFYFAPSLTLLATLAGRP